MKLTKRYDRAGATVTYRLDCKDGYTSESTMPANVALEIVQTAKTLENCDYEGFPLLVDGELLFPEDLIDFEDMGEPEGNVHIVVKGEEVAKPERPWRPRKAELLAKARSLGLEVNERMTNAWLKTLIVEAEKEGAGNADENGEDTAGS